VYQVHEEVFESESVVIGQLQPYSKVKWAGETHMAQMSPKVAEVLDKALELSSHERGLLIDRLVESLDEAPPDEGIDAAWADEIKRRVDEIRSGKVKMIPGEEARQWLSERLRDAKK
jgi:putative addiction module component (TIGR02574 family)